MTTGLGSGTVAAILNQLCNAGTWTDPVGFWVQLHIADPGVAGTTSVAANAQRHTGSFSVAVSATGAITTNADITWTSVSASETYSHVSFWDSSVAGAGTFLGSDNLEVARNVTAGDNFTILSGDIDITLSPVAA